MIPDRSGSPVRVIGELAMRKRGLCPAGVDKANFPFLRCHVGGSRVEDPPVYFAPKLSNTCLPCSVSSLWTSALYPARLSDRQKTGHFVATLSPWTLPGLLRSICRLY